MTLWILIAFITAAAALSILVPFKRTRNEGDMAAATAADEAVYRQQLEEVDKDLERGLIDEEAASAARTEIARRLLALHEQDANAGPGAGANWPGRLALLSALIILPLMAVGTYLLLGSPELPDQPLAARLEAPAENQSLEVLVARIERHLAENPEDGKGWEVVAPVYMRMGNAQAAAKAYQNTIRLLGPTGERLTDFGEALTVFNDGIVSANARGAFEQAVKMDADAVKPRFFLALALGQEGLKEEAIAAWQSLLKGADPSQPWVPVARQELIELGGEAPSMAETLRGPSQDQMAAASGMSAEDRNEMISGMVSGLAERLEAEGGKPEEWLRLIRAYSVLGEKDKARTAYGQAVKAYEGEPAVLTKIREAAGQFGLETN